VIVMMPGPPHEMEPMWRSQVLPRLVRLKLVGRSEPFVQLRTVGVGESALETRIQPLLAKYPKVEVAYCAHAWSVDLRFGWARNAAVEKQARKLAQECRALLGDDVFAEGSATLAETVAELLRSQETTLAVAESGTGGQLANLFTDLPGARSSSMAAWCATATAARSSCSTSPSACSASTARSARRWRWRWRRARRRTSWPSTR
jgi:nicotinamide-nucleotide amidase